jgi:hypothetical protein
MDIRVNVFRRQNGTDQNIGGKPFVLSVLLWPGFSGPATTPERWRTARGRCDS